MMFTGRAGEKAALKRILLMLPNEFRINTNATKMKVTHHEFGQGAT